jgi:hypothetical protein
MRPPVFTPLERFWKKTRPSSGPDDCWQWIGGRGDKLGHGRFWDGEKHVFAHQFSFANWVGVVPEGMIIHHRCRNPGCVRPEHLELTTQSDHGRLHNKGVSKPERRKTHCKRGHPLTGENLLLYRGTQYCRACHKLIAWLHNHGLKVNQLTNEEIDELLKQKKGVGQHNRLDLSRFNPSDKIGTSI